MRRRSVLGAAVLAMAVAGCARSSEPRDNAGAEVNAAPSAAAQDAAPGVDAAGPAAPVASAAPLAIAADAAGLDWGPCPPGMPDGCRIAVLHGDPAQPNADVFLQVPGGAAIAPHWHSSAERMVLVGGRLEVRYRGAAAATLEPGTYAYGPARLPHRADCRSSAPCTLFIAFEGPVDLHAYDGRL